MDVHQIAEATGIVIGRTVFLSIYPFISAVIFAAVSSLFFTFIYKFVFWRPWTESATCCGAVFVVSVVAYLTGYMAGNSREPVVGDIAPVLLGGAGALFALSFVQSKVDSTFAGILTLAFSFIFFAGLVAGSDNREIHQNKTGKITSAEENQRLHTDNASAPSNQLTPKSPLLGILQTTTPLPTTPPPQAGPPTTPPFQLTPPLFQLPKFPSDVISTTPTR